jgi:MFS family permease
LLVEVVPGSEPWRWAFIINIPLAIAAAIAIARLGGARGAINTGWLQRLDLPSVALLAGALFTFNLGLSAGGEIGMSSSGGRALGGSRNPVGDYILPLLIASVLSVLFGGLFIRRQIHAAWPLLPVALFGERRFSAAIIANVLVGASLIVTMVDVPVITALIVEQAAASRVSALLLAPFTLLIALLSLAGGRVATRWGFRLTTSVGFVLVAVGYVALWFGLHDGHLMGMVPGLLIAGSGFGLVFAPVSATAIDAASEVDRGIAAAMTLVFRLLGMTVGISALTAIAVRRLQGLVGDLSAIVQNPGESTADFLARQTAMLYETVLPISLQVVRETFLLAALIALIGLLPAAVFSSRHSG